MQAQQPAKNSFVVSVTPSASNLDNFTQQRINALTHSNGVKYNITNTNAKVLTPPTGITAYREVIYDATKNIIVNNTIPTQVPLKGAAIFFVNSVLDTASFTWQSKQNTHKTFL